MRKESFPNLVIACVLILLALIVVYHFLDDTIVFPFFSSSYLYFDVVIENNKI